MGRKRVRYLSRQELIDTLSVPDWFLVDEHKLFVRRQLIKILKVGSDRWWHNCVSVELEKAPSTFAETTLSLEFNFTVIQPNPYTVELHKIFPHTVRRGESNGGSEHTIDLLVLWLTFVNVRLKAEVDELAAARRAVEAAELEERQLTLAKIAKNRS